VSRPLAITGIGAVTGCGADPAALLGALAHGQPRLARAPDHRYPLLHAHPAAVVTSPLPAAPTRSTALALAAAHQAVEQAGAEAGTLGIALGTCTGGMPESEAAYLRAPEDSHREYLDQEHHRCADAVARALGCHGPRSTHSVACASAACAAAEAIEWVRHGHCPAALILGADALCRITVDGFHALRLLDPAGCRPLCHDRAGMSIGEAGAALLIEDPAHAHARGATVLASLLGWGLAADGYHPTAPEPDGRHLERALRAALDDAGIEATAAGYVNAHGTGTPGNDAAECAALARVFGAGIAVASSKALTGHCMGAAAAVEAVVATLTLCHHRAWASPGATPATRLDAVDVLCADRSLERDVVVSTSLAFGGVDAALVLGGAGRCA